MSAQTSLAPPLSGVRATLRVASVVGTPTKNAWSQVHKFTPLDPHKAESRGELYASLALELQGLENDQITSVSVGHEILTRLNEEYYGPDDFDGTPYELLKKAVETVGGEFGQGSKLEMSCAVVWNSFVYLCVWGAGKVMLSRGGNLATLVNGNQSTVVASGKFQEGDIFILATSAFSKLVDQQALKALLLTSREVSVIADNIIPLAHQSSLPAVAGAIIRVSEVQQIGDSDVQSVSNSDPPTSRYTEVLNADTQKTLTPRKSFFKTFLIKFAEKLPEEVSTTTYRISSSGRKTAVSVGILLLILFSLSIAFGLKQKKEHEYKLTYQEQLTQAETAYSESLLQKDVDDARARELFMQAKQITDELIARGVKDDKLENLKAQIEKGAGDILGEVNANVSVFLDLSLVRSGVVAREIAIHKETLAVLDSGGQRIVSTRDFKDTSVIGGSEKLANPRSVAVYAGRYFSLGDEGVVELDRKGAVSQTLKPDEWGEISKINVFGGNLYLFSTQGKVWRHSGTEGEFGAKQSWLAPGISADFSDLIDLTIDGSIWILDSGGLTRYTHGAPENVRISGLEKPLSNPRAVYTDEELENIYILDNGNGRIVEFTKRGKYVKQYLAGQINEAIDFVVSKTAAKIFLLTSDKILELPL